MLQTEDFLKTGTNAPWQHVALSYSKESGIARIYLDGREVAGEKFEPFDPQTTYNLYFGQRPRGPISDDQYQKNIGWGNKDPRVHFELNPTSGVTRGEHWSPKLPLPSVGTFQMKNVLKETNAGSPADKYTGGMDDISLFSRELNPDEIDIMFTGEEQVTCPQVKPTAAPKIVVEAAGYTTIEQDLLFDEEVGMWYSIPVQILGIDEPPPPGPPLTGDPPPGPPGGPTVKIPEFIKSVAGYWCEDQIPGSEFFQVIQWMIKNDLIRLSETESAKTTSSEIPSWIQSNACLWYQGKIDDKTIAAALEWLIENGIIKI